MKNIIKVFMALILLVSLVGCGKQEETPKENEDQKEEQKETTEKEEEILENKTDTKQGDIEFSDIKIEAFGATNTVSATITNTSSDTVSFKAVLYLKNTDNRILGKVDKEIENLGPKASTDINIDIMGDYTTVQTFEVIVENFTIKE